MGGSLVPPDDDDHNCGLKAQDARLAALMARIEDLERRAAGHKSERRKGSKLPSGHAAFSCPSLRPATTGRYGISVLIRE